MPSFKTLALGASALAFGFATLTAPALAGQTSDHVDSISLTNDGISGYVTLENTSANKHVSAIKIQPTKPSVSLSLSGYVACAKPPFGNEAKLRMALTKMYYGTLGLAHNKVWVQNVLYEEEYKPSYAWWRFKKTTVQIEKVSVSVDQADFVIPLSAIKNGPADLRFDPVALFNQKLQEHVDNGGSKVDFLRQEQVFSVQRPISLGAHCGFGAFVTDSIGGAWETVMVPLTVRYKGDPAVFEKPALNAQLGEGQGLPDQIGGGYQPMRITQMYFQPNMPHHVGACPATTKIRVFYKGEGKGKLTIRITDGGEKIDESYVLPFDAKNGLQHYDFEIDTLKPGNFNLNKTVVHNLAVFVRYNDQNPQAPWTSSQQMDTAVWKHRCTPQVNPVLGGTGGGKVGGYQGNGGNGGPSVSPTLQVKPAVVPRAMPGRVQAPTDGDPATPVIRRAQ